MTKLDVLTLGVLLTTVGCGFARTPDAYHDDTMALLATKNDAIKACYDKALKADPKTSGEVAVAFLVPADTGQIASVKLVTEQTTAPESLSKCVLDAAEGLVLAPPDANSGQASFVWQFKPKGG